MALDTDAVPEASRISPPVLLPGAPNPVQLSVRVTLDPAGVQVGDLECSLPAVMVTGRRPGPLTVELRPGQRLDRDFILRYRLAGAEVGVGAVAVADREGGEGTFVVTVVPPATAGPGGRVRGRPTDPQWPVPVASGRRGQRSGQGRRGRSRRVLLDDNGNRDARRQRGYRPDVGQEPPA